MTNEMEVLPAKKSSLIASMATKYGLDPKVFFDTLKGTIMKADKDGRQATTEEVCAFLIVANKYNLNPFIKEIYAYPDKRGGIVPVVSTDGWTKLMIGHEEYKNHLFRYAESYLTLKSAKPCPEWCEIEIERTDGTKLVIREYLDEVFREITYANPWQTHTKRMLRHKTKIQGAREAFGFSGIYDDDEAARIVEAQTILPSEPAGPIEMPRPKAPSPAPQPAGNEIPKTESAPKANREMSEKPEEVQLASPGQVKNIYSLAAKAGLEGIGLNDFLSARIKVPEKITIQEMQVCLKDIAVLIDEKANRAAKK